ncbi:MAG: ribonuclease Z [Nanoarchaeota archaeon]
MQIIFLGTSSMVPTKDRNHFSFFIKYNEEGMLFDCGEGTQRQLRIAKIKPTSITKIFISHFHGDHVLGLPGLIQTMSASQYEQTLEIYGPVGLKKFMKKMYELFIFDNKLQIKLHEIKKINFLDLPKYSIKAYKLDHSVKCLGYKFIEKDKIRINSKKAQSFGLKEGPLLGRLLLDKKIVVDNKTIYSKDLTYKTQGRIVGFIADTAMVNNCLKIADNCDILISEATHTSKHIEKAEKYKHLTSKQVGFIANDCNVKKLILTHFSQRYKDINELIDEAKDIFPNTIAAYDFLKINL